MSDQLINRRPTPILTLVAALFFAAAGETPAPAQTYTPRVVVTIAPVHSLTASIMEGVGSPDLLIRGTFSEHTYAEKPSDARKINDADVLIRVASNLESFLNSSWDHFAKVPYTINLNTEPGMVLWPVRAGGNFQPHSHGEEEHASHNHSGNDDHSTEGHLDKESLPDPHTWLDPANAAVMAERIAAKLVEANPSHADQYRRNLAALKSRLSALNDELRAELLPLHDKPYVVFHDAYQYFERRYGLSPVGSISLSSAQAPGARHMDELRQKIRGLKAVCVFTEPQFDPKLANALIEGSGARTAMLDGLGANLTAGPNLYFDLLRKLAQDLRSCVASGQ